MKEKKTTTKQSMEFLSDMMGVLAVLKKAGINNLITNNFIERYGTELGSLTSKDASAFIRNLQQAA
jgi:hypothetical protein